MDDLREKVISSLETLKQDIPKIISWQYDDQLQNTVGNIELAIALLKEQEEHISELMDVPSGSEDYKRGYIDGARHVLEEMDEAPTVDAVPLDKLCELLSKGAYPCTVLNASLCPFESCRGTSRYSNNVSKNCWMGVLTKWMEEQNV